MVTFPELINVKKNFHRESDSIQERTKEILYTDKEPPTDEAVGNEFHSFQKSSAFSLQHDAGVSRCCGAAAKSTIHTDRVLMSSCRVALFFCLSEFSE